MQYNLSKFPLSEDDQQLKDDSGKLVTYREALMKCVAADVDGAGQPIKGESKFLRYQIWKKLKSQKETIALSAEEVALVKQACQVFPVIVSGQIQEFLEDPEKGNG